MNPSDTRNTEGRVALRLILGILILGLLPVLLLAAEPTWWTTKGVLKQNPTANDYAAVNQGQLKNIATAALAEMDTYLPVDTEDALHGMVNHWATHPPQANDYAAVNLGQLKTVAKPFYDRLLFAGYQGHPLESGTYPWINGTANNYAMANIGQVKNLFSFNLATWDGSKIVTFISRSHQNGAPNTLTSSPLAVQVNNAITGRSVEGCSVTFTVVGGSNRLASSSTSTVLSSTLTLQTDSNGQILDGVYYLLPDTEGTSGQVIVSVGLGLPVVFNFTSDSSAEPFQITSPTAVTTAENAPFSYAITTSTSANSVHYGASGLPAGLVVNGTTGTISGAPTALGVSNVILSATSGSVTASAVLMLNVVSCSGSIPVINSLDVATATAGSTFAYRITASNNPMSFGATPLPEGLSLDVSNGMISGTVSSAILSSTISVNLSAANCSGTGTQVLTMVIDKEPTNGPVPVISSTTSVSGTVGQLFSYAITHESINTAVSYNAIGLPEGLVVSVTTGTISGRPTTSGTYLVPIVVSNSNGSASEVLQIEIAPGAPFITSPLNVTVPVNSFFYYRITANNPPDSFGAAGLPDGISLSSSTTGEIRGTASSSGTSQVVLTGTYKDNTVVSGTMTLTVDIARPVIDGPCTVTPRVGTFFDYGISASNSPTEYSSSDLPPGLVLNPSTGRIRGTPTIPGSYIIALSASNSLGSGTGSLNLNVALSGTDVPLITGPSIVYGNVVSSTVILSNNPTSVSISGPAWLSINQSTGVISGTIPAVGTFPVVLTATNASGTASARLLVVGTSTSTSVTTTLQLQAGVSPTLDYTTTSATIESGTSLSVANQVFQFEEQKVGYIDSSTFARALFGFDLSFVPTDAVVTSASLQLSGSLATSSTMELSEADGPFYPRVACWTINHLTKPSALGSLSGSGNGSFTWSSSGIVNAVHEAIVNPARTPLSLMLKMANESNLTEGQAFYVSDEANATLASHPLLSITYTTSAPPVIFSGSAIGVSGTFFSYTAKAINGLSGGPLPWTSGTISPDGSGLTFYPATGVISGTPATTGTFTVALSATNANGTGTGTITLNIGNAPVLTSATSISLSSGTSFSFAVGGSNANATTFSANELPNGLQINPISGVISGNVPETNVGEYQITIIAKNFYGVSTKNLTINVAFGVPVITSSNSIFATKDNGFDFSVTASNSPTSYHYVGTDLPGGIAFTEFPGEGQPLSAVISGTPTTTGTFHVTGIAATNIAGSSGTTSLTIIVEDRAITSGTAATATVGAYFDYMITAQGSPVAYEADATKLPAGLSFDTATHLISGTAMEPGEVTIPISATYASGAKATSSLLLTTSISSSDPDMVFQNGVSPSEDYQVPSVNIINKVIHSLSGQTIKVDQAIEVDQTINSGTCTYFQVGRASALVLTNTTIITGTATATGTTVLTGTSEVKRALLCYDISALPLGATVTNVRLELNVSSANSIGAAPLAVELHESTVPFDPSVANWANNSGFKGTLLSSQNFDPATVSGTSIFGNTGAFRKAVQQAAESGGVLYLSLSSPAAESGTTASYISFSSGTSAPQQSPKLVVKYSIPDSAPVIVSPTLVSGTVGVPLSYTIKATNAPTSFYASGSLPTGLSINETTGVISGSAAEVGSTYATVVAAKKNKADVTVSGSAMLLFSIANAPQPVATGTGGLEPGELPMLSVVSGQNQSGTAGQVFPFVVQATNRLGQPVAAMTLTLSCTTGGGISPISGGSFENTLSAVTDSMGKATVYLKAAAPNGTLNRASCIGLSSLGAKAKIYLTAFTRSGSLSTPQPGGIASFTLDTDPPSSPPSPESPTMGLEVKKTGDDYTSVIITWNYTGADKYVVERKINSGAWSQVAKTYSPATTSYDSGLLAGQTYYYRIVPDGGGSTNPPSAACSYRVPLVKGGVCYDRDGKRCDWVDADGTYKFKLNPHIGTAQLKITESVVYVTEFIWKENGPPDEIRQQDDFSIDWSGSGDETPLFGFHLPAPPLESGRGIYVRPDENADDDDDDDDDPPGPQPNYSLPFDEASGAKYRKIALNGLPLADGKPQHEEETDQEKEETFVDALTLGLRHSTTDVYLPVAGSDLAVSARRDVRSDVWNMKSGLRPKEQPDRPFGQCWSSNLAPNIRINTSNNPKRTDPDKAYVTDESGGVHTFAIWYDNAGQHFFPMPMGKNEQTPNLETLTVDNSTTPARYIFKRKYGTTLVYEGTDLVLTVSADRMKGSSYAVTDTYARLTTATDRVGNTVVYEFEGTTNLIPKTISVVNQPAIKLYIKQENNRIASIWDANYNETKYGYDSKGRLSTVTAPDEAITTYNYVDVDEEDETPRSLEDPLVTFYHVDLAGITDPRGYGYTFSYNTDHTKLNYMSDPEIYTGYYAQCGLPRTLAKVTLPTGTSTFVNDSKVWVEYVEKKPVQKGHRRIHVTDATGFNRTYRFENAQVIPLPQLKTGYPTNSCVDAKIVCYRSMSIDHGSLGTEKFTFDVNAAMALQEIKDFSGNITKFVHAEPWVNNISQPYRMIMTDATVNGFYGDPTSQINALNFSKTFTYDPDSRVMTSVADEEGRITSYTLDSLKRRIREAIYPSAHANLPVKLTAFQYSNPKFPGFMTQKSIFSSTTMVSGTVPSWPTCDLITQYEPDANGRVAREIVDPFGLQPLVTSYTYDANGNKLTSTDAKGQTTWFSYDSRNRLVTVTYADGTQKQTAYDERGNKIAEYDENGFATLFEYDGLNRLIQQTRDMNGNGTVDVGTDLITKFTYNNVNSKLTVTDPNGGVTKMDYDDIQRLKTTTDAQNHTTQFFYTGANAGSSAFDTSGFKPTKTIDPRGYITNISYDKLYRPLQKLIRYSKYLAATSTIYDKVGNPHITTDAAGNQTTVEYDALNRPVKTTYADGQCTKTYYTTTGLKFKVEDENGHATETHYDTAGRPIRVVTPPVEDKNGVSTSGTTQTIYDLVGNVSATIKPINRRWDYTYDARNRKIQQFDPDVEVVTESGTATMRPIQTWAYDPAGRVTTIIDARGNPTDTLYDNANRVTDIYAPSVPFVSGTTNGTARPHTHSTYDANGNVLTVTDPNGHTTVNTYDLLNHLRTTCDAAKNLVRYEYDEVGNRTLVTDGNGNDTTFEYEDGFNRNTKIIDATGKATKFVYDGLNKTQRIDANGLTTTYRYDARNRLKTVTYASTDAEHNSQRNYQYDNAGNLLHVTEPGKNGKANVDYTYDALNRVSTETSSGYTHHYWYDVAGNRVRALYSGSTMQVDYTYDALDRPETVFENGRTTRYGYDAASNMTRKTLPNGDVESMLYDNANRRTWDGSTASSGTAQYGYVYAHDLGGNLTLIQESNLGNYNQHQTFTYDGANRLTDETSTEFGSKHYHYDKANNRTSFTDPATGALVSCTYNTLNQIIDLVATGTNGTTEKSVTYTYDANGNRKTRTSGGYIDQYSYDAENRLTELTTGSNGKTYAYTYDYRTRRVEKHENDQTTKIVFSGGLSVMEYVNNSTIAAVQYIRGRDMGGGVAGILYSNRGTPATPALSFDHFNIRGDLVATTNPSGDKTWQGWYDAFGTHTHEGDNKPADPQRANTKEEELWGGLNEGFRYRDLETGVFLTQDPAGFVDGPNLYTYVKQNPWTSFDPEGLASFSDIEAKNKALEQRLNDVAQSGNPTGSESRAELEAISQQATQNGMAWLARAAVDFVPKLTPEQKDKVADYVEAGFVIGVAIKKGKDATSTPGGPSARKGAAVQTSKFRGGVHSETSKPVNDQLDSHHMPAKSVSGIPAEQGPAIQMDPSDHRLTSSHGSQPGSAEYRAMIGKKIQDGDMRGAMSTEIRDVRRAAQQGSGDATKYNGAMREMMQKAKTEGYIPPNPKRDEQK